MITAVSKGLARVLRAWGARGRVFESLRPDRIIQKGREILSRDPFLFVSVLPPQKDWPWVLFGIGINNQRKLVGDSLPADVTMDFSWRLLRSRY